MDPNPKHHAARRLSVRHGKFLALDASHFYWTFKLLRSLTTLAIYPHQPLFLFSLCERDETIC